MTKDTVTAFTLPRPDKFLTVYAYAPSGGEWLWQTGQLCDTEEEAIAYGMSIGNADTIRIVRVSGLEKFHAPDTLKRLQRSDGTILEYTEDEPEPMEAEIEDSAD